MIEMEPQMELQRVLNVVNGNLKVYENHPFHCIMKMVLQIESQPNLQVSFVTFKVHAILSFHVSGCLEWKLNGTSKEAMVISK